MFPNRVKLDALITTIETSTNAFIATAAAASIFIRTTTTITTTTAITTSTVLPATTKVTLFTFKAFNMAPIAAPRWLTIAEGPYELMNYLSW